MVAVDRSLRAPIPLIPVRRGEENQASRPAALVWIQRDVVGRDGDGGAEEGGGGLCGAVHGGRGHEATQCACHGRGPRRSRLQVDIPVVSL